MSAWKSHQEGCPCSVCTCERDWENLTSEMLPEMPESPSMARRIWSAIRETAIWAALLTAAVIMWKCAS